MKIFVTNPILFYNDFNRTINVADDSSEKVRTLEAFLGAKIAEFKKLLVVRLKGG